MDEPDISVEFLLENLELVLSDTSNSVLAEDSPIVISLYEDLKIIKSFLKRIQQAPIYQKERQSFLLTEIRDVVLKIVDATDSYVINALTNNNGIFGTDINSLFQHSPELAFRAKHIGLIKKVIFDVDNDASSSFLATKEVGEVSDEVSSISKNSSPILKEEKMVGFDDEAISLLDKLTGDQKQLELISLVGMAGIGKTTLAKRLYSNPRVAYHFHIRGWTSGLRQHEVSNALHDILSSIIDNKDSLHTMTRDEMGEKLYKCLKGKRYIIVIDDIWDFISWNMLKWYFPNDTIGSKILITSRIRDVVLEISPHNSVFFLRFLNQDESWSLFESQVFTNESCPQELMELGNEIVAKCKGLPLAIVVLAGLAKKDMRQEWWMYINENTAACFHGEEEQFMDILELSYQNLPNSLKSCFLYLGSFSQNYEIPVKKLVWSWIAEGFIDSNGEKKVEDTSEDYLKDLVERNLVIVSKRRSSGGIKTCNIHDLIRDLCVKKAKDENFLQPSCGYTQISLSPPPRPILYNYFTSTTTTSTLAYKIPDGPYCRCFHSYYFHSFARNDVNLLHIGIFTDLTRSIVYKLLRVLDLGYIILGNFPMEILQLVHLKYLGLRFYSLRKLPLLSKLWNLETFIIDTEKGPRVILPQDIWKMIKLRHLHISGELVFENVSSSSSTLSMLYNLQSISHLCPSGSIQDVLARIPNLTYLACHLTLSNTTERFGYPDLSSLKQLETLKFDYQTFGMVPFSVPEPSKFPPNLKKLTLIGSHIDWKKMAIIGLLPNLEILKIKDNFFNGPPWETIDEGFCRLKFLKLSHTDLQQWTASSSSFPCLERLVLNGCLDLEEIPSSFGDIYTLEMIELYHSSQSAADSARQIQESQRYMGNDELKVLIHPHFEEE